MKNFITTYKWVCLPVVLTSAAVLSNSAMAAPVTSQHYKDAQQTSRANHQYVGGNTQIGAGITDQGTVDLNVNQVLSKNNNRSTSAGLWADYDVTGDDKGLQGRGVEVNHNWVSRDATGQAKRVNKAKAAYDRNASGHERVTLGYGQETQDMFWDGRVSKGLSGNKDSRDSGNETISDRAYEYGVGASVGTFLPDSNLRVRGGLDHEWSTKVGNGESDARNTTLSAGVEKFFDGTGHSVSLDVSGSKRSGGYQNGASSDNDYSARLGYKYDFAGSNAFQNATSTRRIRVEVPGNTVAPRTQFKQVPTYKTVPVYGKKIVKVPYKRMIKSTMGLEGQTFFKKNSSKLIPSAQKRLSQIANEIRKTGYKGSIRITGNTCGLGSAEYDQVLSERRANSVRAFLIKKGFNPNHLMARGLGKAHPKYRNVPGEGFKNRRVDIEYVSEVNVAKTAYRSEEKTVQTGTRKVATGFKNVPNGTKNVMIDNGKTGSPRVIWKTETVNNPPAWISRALNNNIKHVRTINTFQTSEDIENNLNALDDSAKTDCGVPVTIDVLGNDSNTGATITSFTQGANGSVTQGANGSLIYTPTGNGCGVDDTFTYTISDGNGGIDTATVTVAVNDDDTVVAVNEETDAQAGLPLTIDVLSNDDFDAVLRSIVTQPTNGTAEIVNGKIVYTPRDGFVGTDTFVYEVEDANGNRTTAKVTVNVTGPANTAPVANNDRSSVACSGPVTIDVLENDSDPENGTFSVLDFTQPANGTVTKAANGQLIYTSNGNSCGTDDQFTYRITDGENTSNIAKVTIAIGPKANSAPKANDDQATTQVNQPITLMTVANDTDADGDDLTITNVGQPQNGKVTNDGKKITYTPDPGFTGVDIFDYTITDGNGGTSMATETVTVTAAPNTKPVAKDDSATTQESTPVTLMTVANDTDADGDDLTITDVQNPANGTVTNDGKKITYTPKPGFIGMDKFTYTITDGNGGTATATETVIVEAIPNKAPIANTDSASTGCQIITINALANDTDNEGDQLTIVSVGGSTLGKTKVVNNKIVFEPLNTCDKGSHGKDTVEYTITDGTNTSTGKINLEVVENGYINPRNDDVTTFVNTPVDINVLLNDEGVDIKVVSVGISNSSHGSVDFTGSIVSYTPEPGFTGVAELFYDVQDVHGNTDFATVKVTVVAAGTKH